MLILNGFSSATLALITPPFLPKGGKALSQSGPDGLASITLPLPISALPCAGAALQQRWRQWPLRRGLVLRDNEHCPPHQPWRAAV